MIERTAHKKFETATFGAGCFWQVEDVFMKLMGVISTEAGFMGGTVPNPSYRQVCGGNTGHAEVINIVYDPNIVSYKKLLDIFWDNHDPTSLNRQGPDIGEQYRSVIFYRTPEQKLIAEESLEEQENSGKFENKIVTQIVPASTFYRAEDYHQKYFQKMKHQIT